MFQREDRYIVLKLSKLSERDALEIRQLVNDTGRSDSLTECVVVEADWPNYEQTWRDIESATRGEFKDRAFLQLERDSLRARVVELENDLEEANILLKQEIQLVSNATI